MIFAAVAIKLTSPGRLFFRQERATIGGRVFQIIKFRTMYETACDALGQSACENDGRITRVGRFLRKYRIDELPQLLNVLMGDMSIVGPRPEMLENVNRYTQEVPEFEYRNQMKAGLTGMAQIDGKYNTTPKDKVILDLLYIENFSLMMDLKLVMRTATIFFRRDSTEGFQAGRKAFCPIMRTCDANAEETVDSGDAGALPEIELNRENTPMETVINAETLFCQAVSPSDASVAQSGDGAAIHTDEVDEDPDTPEGERLATADGIVTDAQAATDAFESKAPDDALAEHAPRTIFTDGVNATGI
jgi:lipopolysaccharide/colanic/teichoic acid biosynthesis glycosyltransferase